MIQAPLSCPKCKAPLASGLLNQPDWQPCPSCQTQLQTKAYPALFRPVTVGRASDLIMVDGESSCFYHPAKKAVRPCESCGRFVCALCDCELHGQHFCPVCLEIGKKKGRIKSLINQRPLYDSVALSLSFLPILLWPFTCVTAPTALYIAIRYWNAPRSPTHRTKVRLVFAIIFATLQIAAWTMFISSVINSHG